MSKLKDFMRIVNERDRARINVEALNRQLKNLRRVCDDLTEYCKTQDEHFMVNWRRWSDAKELNKKTWDYERLFGAMTGHAAPPRELKFETNVPKIEFEEPMPEGCPGCGIKPSSTGRIEHAHNCPGRGAEGGENG